MTTALKALLDGFRRKRAPPPGWIEQHAPANSLEPLWATATAVDMLHLWIWWSTTGGRPARATLVFLARELLAMDLPEHRGLALLDRWLGGDDDTEALRAAAGVERERRLPEDNDDDEEVVALGTFNSYARDLAAQALEVPYQPRAISGAFVAAVHIHESRISRTERAKRHAELTDLVRKRLPCPPLEELIARTKTM